MADISSTPAPIATAGPAASTATSAHKSAVSWAAIFAGAAAAAALSLILLMLGVGLGLSSASPWAQEGLSAETLGLSTILWITFTQLVAAGLGGYLAGRLRAQWLDTPGDEVYFRDTAHGFLAWAVATLATAALLTSSIAAIVGGSARVAADVVGSGVGAVASAATQAAGEQPGTAGGDVLGYYVDRLFRQDARAPTSGLDGDRSPPPTREIAAAESTRILVHALGTGELPANDTAYLGRVVAQRTGLNQQEAKDRVSQVFSDTQAALESTENQAREAADKARKAAAHATLWMFIALLVGAFVASLAATWGGRQRDDVVVLMD